MFDVVSVLRQIAIWALPVLLAVTVHEVAHGLAARRLGDDTAARLGRLSLNPIKHVDLVGTISVPGMLLLMGTGFLFGWAKPVPVDFRALGNPRRDMALVAVAGPASNLVMAVLWALLLKLTLLAGIAGGISLGLASMAMAGVAINLVLMILNMLPLPPLDGGRVAVGLLPVGLANALARVEPFGFIILVLMLATGVLAPILYVPLEAAQTTLFALLGIAR